MSEIHDLQFDFFLQLKQRLGAQVILAEEVAATLGVSKSEAYNKINCKSALTLKQLHLLCTTYRVPYTIFKEHSTEACAVQYTPFHSGKISLNQYLARMNRNMEMLVQAGVQKLLSATDDVPFYHLFKYPELAAFKLYYWNKRTTAADRAGSASFFTAKSISREDIAAAFNVHKVYQQVPCLEIWTKSHLLIILDQFRYTMESGLLQDKGLANEVINQLLSCFDDIEEYASTRMKRKDVGFEWYSCDVVNSVAYLAETAAKDICFLRFNTFNHFQSDNEALCAEVRLWLQSLLNDAIGFSGQGSKHRNRYLLECRQLCEELKSQI